MRPFRVIPILGLGFAGTAWLFCTAWFFCTAWLFLGQAETVHAKVIHAQGSVSTGAANTTAANSGSANSGSANSGSDSANTGAEASLVGALKLRVQERGPRHPWLFTVTNAGQSPVRFVSDTRLVWFTVQVPGEKTEKTCMLPDNMRPGFEHLKRDHRVTSLAPGESYVRHIDPRFYCFAEGDQTTLVPGAQVTAHMGWPDETRTVWQKGKRVLEILPATPPFVAWPWHDREPPSESLSEASSEHEFADEAGQSDHEPDSAADAPARMEHNEPGHERPPLRDAEHASDTSPDPVIGIRHIDGETFALSSAYAMWSADDLPSSAEPPRRRLTLRVSEGSDAKTERGVSVTVTFRNSGSEALHFFFRREFLTFEVMGPDGLKRCELEDEIREPERQAFSSLAPGKEMRVPTRLVELCPRGTFSKTGFYLVNARFEGRDNGERFQLNAFTGSVATRIPKPVRVQTSEEPFIVTVPIMGGQRGGAGAPPGAAQPGAVPPVPPPPPPPPAPEG